MRTAEVIDRYISAQFPDPELYPNLFNLVSTHMIHGPCGPRCEKDGRCSKGFAKKFQENTTLDEDAYPTYARPDNGRSVTKSSGFVADNRYVVPHCPNLLLLMNCHINVEVVSSIKAVKYLYKYIFKGHDCAAFKIVDGVVHYDECESFLNSRYMGAAEACWRIFGFELHKQSHSISRLPLHLPNEQTINFTDAENIEDLQAAMDSKNKFLDWFELNKRDTNARKYFYHEIPEHYTWAPIPNQKLTNADGTKNKKQYQWKTREASFKVIGRMYSASPTNPELFHLRILLNHVKGATSFEDLKTVGTTVCQTFTQACLELGLIEDDKEWARVLEEAEVSLSPYQMRNLFVRLLIHCQPIAPHELWEKFKKAMAEDFALQYPQDIAIKKAYREICRLLENEDSDITKFPTMPQDLAFDDDYDIYDPIYDETIGDQMRAIANPEQENVIDKVLKVACDEKNPLEVVKKCFYIDGPGGSGKTYVYKTLWHLLRSKGKKVSTMAFTGIAAILLPEGRTCHKTLGLPVPIYADSNSSIKPNTKQAKDLIATDVFIWDEAPMAPKYALEIMNRLLRDLMKNEEPFGGKILLLGGDFRQLLPVRKNGTRSECVSLSIKFSNLWELFETYKLHRNMRADDNEIEFANYLLAIGEGKLNDEDDNIEFPEEFIVETDLAQEVYGTLIQQNRFNEVANSAILSARNADVDELNKEVVEMLDASTERLYTSIDSAVDGEALQELITQEYLNSLNPASLPPQELCLKKNTVVMLIRNLSKNEGLCNGTRLLVIGLLNNSLQCKILTGDKKGETVFIHRILLYNEENYPFTLARRQFPVKIAFAMTVNKSRGQTFEKVGLDLRKDVFNHGQLYKCKILSARNADVDELNKEVVEMLDASAERLYTSIDSAIDGESLQELITQEYLNSLNPPSLPPHELCIRKNRVVMLIRNLSKNEGLVNGTRLLVIGLLNNSLQCKILTGDKKGEIVFIHRIIIYNEENYPFTLARRQFPVKIAFAMTINKSQGQTFDKVGLDLRKDVFNHGQMYVACSRVKRPSSLKIYLGKQRLNKKDKNLITLR
uniref:ATP-dependent DNA helicase n=1 Tax=Panagrolaimus sp. PS1159 TaxID=55785 RepID=A0AC35FFM5_9BILA